MEKQRTAESVRICCLLFVFMITALPFRARAAGDDVCARVKIEIQQELTLERQGFDAHMRITNGLSGISLENVRVEVSFADEQGDPVSATTDPGDTGALFFIRTDRMENIDDVDGAGTVTGSSSADIHWLIIPAPGASNGLESGKMYYVGAVLSYTINGEEHTTEVSPDYIFVKPLPQLRIDYFLPDEVFADDAFTDAIEPPVPFSLGVRVSNSGAGVARHLKIDSAQPRIVENEQGLLINFMIDGSTVDDQPASDSLLATFGDIVPHAAATARWRMHCTLSGRFIEFTAEFSHANELGGELTSLVEAVNTHFLVRDVRVDLPGRDGVRDFLARDGGIYRVYESQNTETEVTDQSSLSALSYLDRSGTETRYTLATAPTAGLLYVHLPDPHQGARIVTGAVRSDGKRIGEENVWLSKTRDAHSWKYFINLFDASGTDRYTITFDDPASQPRAPVLQFIPDKSRAEGEQLSFLVAASDPDGTVPVLAAAPLPAGAHFSDQGGGQGIFDWTPVAGQAGTYAVGFTASDGVLTGSETVTITVYSADDTDGDGLDDSWETKYFGSLSRDGHGDFDGDGFTDLEEYRNGTDPTAENSAPTVPVIDAPEPGGRVTATSPLLSIFNSSDADGDALTYEFEVFTDDTLRTRVAAETGVVSGSGTTTAWQVPAPLADNHGYTWRVRASDGFARSLWTYGTFSVDTANDAPAVPQPAFPAPDRHVCTLTPELQVIGVADPDGDELTCTFAVYADSSLASPVAASPPVPVTRSDDGDTAWQVDTALADAAWYYWRVKITDPRGGVSFSPTAVFYVDPADSAPRKPVVSSPSGAAVVPAGQLALVVANGGDPDGDALVYRFELDTVPTFDSAARQVSGDVSEGVDTTSWQVAGLADNTRYYWRVRASDGSCSSAWERGTFFVSSANDAPLVPIARNPGKQAWSATLRPVLEVAPGVDADHDALDYEFEIYTDEALTDLVARDRTSAPQWQVPSALADKAPCYWRARAVDPQNAAGGWMAPVPVFVKAVQVEPPDRISLRVRTDAGQPLEGVDVFAFTESGMYTGSRARTDDTGTALFETADFADGTYVFRVDYRGHRFWSDPLGLPGTYTLAVTIALRPVMLTVTAAAGPVAGARVYLFSATGVYLGTYALTDADGRVAFDLPVGKAFKFRTDILGGRYWSDEVVVAAGGSSTVVDTGGGRLLISLQKAQDEPMAGIRLYLFSDGGSYLGRVETTDEQGRAAFDLPRGTYRVRADYLGYRFWSEDTAVVTDTAVAMTIGHHDAELAVSGVFQEESVPLKAVDVYLFSSAGSYLGRSAVTDENGSVRFSLPEKAYQVRVDVLGGSFWSPEFTADPGGQPVAVDIPMAAARVSVTGAGLPREDVPVYLFSEAGSYLGRVEPTDADGRVDFRVPEGKYNFRADYQGSRFWSGAQSLARDQATPVNISAGGGVFTLQVETGERQPLPGVKVHVFNSSGAYIGLSGAADENGETGFDLSGGSYRFRVDYLGQQFWSDPVTVPDALSAGVTIAEAPVTLTVTTAAGPAADVQVTLFSPDGAYLGRWGRTDAAGRVVFDLPVGRAFKFRADIPGGRYWSDEIAVAVGGNAPSIDAGGGRLQVTIEKSPATPLENIRVYLFSEAGSYLGRTETTDASGAAGFDVPRGNYRLRADYLGYRFWTEPYAVEADVSGTLTIGHRDVTVTVQGAWPSAEPLAGVRAYLFNSSGSYLGREQPTDSDGRVTFSLPDRAYRVRADYLGGQYWSEDFQSRDTAIDIDRGRTDLHVHRTGTNVPGARVYVFSDSGRYLGLSADTDADGRVSFILPAGEFRFRVDRDGGQFWSGTVSLLSGGATPVEMDLDTF